MTASTASMCADRGERTQSTEFKPKVESKRRPNAKCKRKAKKRYFCFCTMIEQNSLASALI